MRLDRMLRAQRALMYEYLAQANTRAVRLFRLPCVTRRPIEAVSLPPKGLEVAVHPLYIMKAEALRVPW